MYVFENCAYIFLITIKICSYNGDWLNLLNLASRTVYDNFKLSTVCRLFDKYSIPIFVTESQP